MFDNDDNCDNYVFINLPDLIHQELYLRNMCPWLIYRSILLSAIIYKYFKTKNRFKTQKR